MTAARTLPATLAPRFARAPRTVVRLETVSFEVVIAKGFLLRLRGLAGLAEADAVPLLFPACRSVHTLGMRAAIDVVWLELDKEGKGTVLAVAEALPPRRTTRAPSGADWRRTAALELPAGEAAALGLQPGARVTLRS